MKADFLSRYTPRLMSPEVLENIFVQRQELAQELVDRIRESVLTSAKYHTLLTGPRGLGKTHLVSLVYHRIRDDLRDHLLIAWLSEEEWSVTSFLDLLLCIFQALQEESNNSKGAQPCPPTKGVESLYEMPVDAAESEGAALLKEFIDDSSTSGRGTAMPCPYSSRTLLLIVENLDDLFAGLGKDGQKQLRTFLEENSCIVLATAQTYFKDVKQKNSPFYGFFCHEELKELKADDATQLLANIAKHNKNDELASFIQTQTGRDRIKAVHFLAGGNHRLYVIFSEFLTDHKSLAQLVDAFMRTLDDLTPYYQERMRFLSPQQRKMIDFLCARRHAVTVKEIAQRCFITHQTASSQLKDLKEKGYVNSQAIGRESFYELREPLMRFCLEVKKQRGEPIRLFVDFLRLWYSQQELQERLERLSSEEMLQAVSLEREYVLYALKEINHDSLQQHSKATDANATVEANASGVASLSDEDPHVAAYWQEYLAYFEQNDWLSALSVAEKLVVIRGNADDWFQQGYCLDELKRYEEALASYDKSIELIPDYYPAWYNRSIALRNLGRLEEASTSYDKSIELKPDDPDAWYNKGIVLRNLGRLEEAIASYDKSIELKPDDPDAWYNKGYALLDLGQLEQAIASFDKVIELKPNDHSVWNNRGYGLKNLGRLEEAIASFNKAIEFKPDDHYAWYSKGIVLRNLGQLEKAIASFDKAIELKPNDHYAWYIKGIMLMNLGRLEEAMASFDKAIEFKPDAHYAWYSLGIALRNLGQIEEAIASYDKAIELKADDHSAWILRGIALFNLGQLEEVIASCDKAIELKRDDPDAWILRSFVLRYLGHLEEAIASWDQAIAIKPNYHTGWYNRGNALESLGRIEEALASYDKAIEIDPNYKWAWLSRGWLLNILGRYEETLASCDKAIELGYQSSKVFFNRAIALLGLNRWDEGIVELENSLDHLSQEPEAFAEDAELIARNLFNIKNDAAIWRSRIKTLIELYDKHQVLSALGQGLVRSIPLLMSEMVSDKAAQTWLEVWRELTSDYPEFQIPLRLLNAAVRYRETKGDKRVLLELPIEERNLLKPLLGISEEAQ